MEMVFVGKGIKKVRKFYRSQKSKQVRTDVFRV